MSENDPESTESFDINPQHLPELYTPRYVPPNKEEISLDVYANSMHWNLQQLYTAWAYTPRASVKAICLLAMTTAKLLKDRHETLFPHYADKRSINQIPIVQPLD